MTNDYYNKGRVARRTNIERTANPYKKELKFPLWQRPFITKRTKRLAKEEATLNWYRGWDDEDNVLNLEEEHETIKEAQQAFAEECFKDHKRLNFLLTNYLRRNGGYVDLAILAAMRADFGNSNLDVIKFKEWIDTAMSKQSDSSDAYKVMGKS